MRAYALSRLGWAVAMVVGVAVLGFLMTHLLPGNPIDALVGDFPAPPAFVAQLRVEFGLDKSLSAQLWLYLGQLAHGNLGFSFVNRQPVFTLILERAVTTLDLMLPALLVASVLGVVIAVTSAAHAGRFADTTLTTVTLIGYSIPVFWLAQILIVLFAVDLGWLPAQGIASLRAPRAGMGAFIDGLQHLILPMFCITIYYMAIVARVARSSVLEMLHQDFVLTARAKGLGEGAILWRHVLPNGLMPVITVIGYNFGYSLTGAILTETVFGWPGLGGLLVSSINNRDYPVLTGIFLFVATLVVIANLVTDLVYAAVDPRVRVALQGSG
jgi:peptide/nickel transport system permease protein